MALIHLENENFDELKNKGIVVVDFFATWCGPCKMLSPIIEALANDLPNVTFIKVDVDKHDELAHSYGVMSIPTLIFCKDGNIVEKKIGFIDKDNLTRIINSME